MGGRAESLHIMSWKTRSNSDRQEKGNWQDGCGNAGDVTDKGTEKKGIVQQESRREDSSQAKRKGQWQYCPDTDFSNSRIFVYLKIYIHIVCLKQRNY